jgi:two-component system, LytTR family, sensor kinase
MLPYHRLQLINLFSIHLSNDNLITLEIVEVFSGGVKQLFKRPLLALLNASVWLLVFSIITILLNSFIPLKDALVFASYNVLLLLGMYYLNIHLVNVLVEKQFYALYTSLFCCILVVTAALRIYINLRFINQADIGVLTINERWIFLFSTFTTLIVLLISFFNGLLMNRSQKEREYLSVIAHHQNARAEFLKTQMSPHFLFNTLNNIYSLTIGKAPHASQMILLLSDVLRYAVYKSKEGTVELATEVDQIEKLVQLHALRSERKPQVTFTANISSTPFFIEPMILIPLVENCFKHGNIETSTNAFINIRLWEGAHEIIFETHNSREKSIATPFAPQGIGLTNIKERLRIRYANRHSLETIEQENSFLVRLQIKKN